MTSECIVADTFNLLSPSPAVKASPLPPGVPWLWPAAVGANPQKTGGADRCGA